MSKATLIEFWRDLMLSDEAMEQYKVNRKDAVAHYDLSDQERHSLLNDDFAAIYKGGVPLELLLQVSVLAGLHPYEYMQKLHSGLNYTGRGMIAAGAAASSELGSWIPPD
jgi:hypothetical protein